MIKEKMEQTKTFTFKKPSRAEIEKNIRNLDISKACQENDIPTKIIKENCEIFAEFIESNFSYNIEEAEFPDMLKMADIKPIYKKISRNEKGNYRPVSVLPNLSKVYEKEFYLNKCHHFLKIFCLNTNAVSERVLALNIAY